MTRILWTIVTILAVMWAVEAIAAFTGFHIVDALVPRMRLPLGGAGAPSNAPGQV